MAEGEAAQPLVEVAALLSDPATHGGAEVERIDTHISIVFLAGARAFKIKRAVRYAFLDFTTLARRREFCEAELRLNRRTAPDLYLRLLPVTREADGRLRLDGAGPAVEWVVEMRRFDGALQFDHLADSGRLTAEMIVGLVDGVLDFHAASEVLAAPFGGAEALAGVIDDNAADMAARPAILPADRAATLASASRAALSDCAALLDQRHEDGQVRLCHGDLHLGNIVLWQGRPTPFDCVEFSRRLAGSDVFYDLAFLLMDLDVRGLRGLANLAMNRYLGRVGGVGVLAALPLMLSLRAGIRAKVAALAADAQRTAAATTGQVAAARGLLAAAESYLAPVPPRLVAIGGLSGSGKSTLGRALAPALGRAPGALQLRSDVLRKRLYGKPPEAPLPAEAYAPEVGARVYATLLAEARSALAAGQAVVVDAVYARPDERAALERLAAELSLPFDGLWLEAPPAVLRARVAGRAADASDATVAVVEQQLGYDLGPVSWTRLPATDGAAKVAAAARRSLGLSEAA